MFAWIAGIAKFAGWLAVGLLLLSALLVYCSSVIGRFYPRGVQIGTFTDINDSTKELGPFVIGRAKELSQPISLDALYEVKVPPITNNFGARENLKALDDVKLSFQGVDVPSVIRVFFNALPDDHYIVNAKPANAGLAGPLLNMDLTAPSGEQKSWVIRLDRPVSATAAAPASGTAAPPASAMTSQAVDRAIYTMWYHMYYDPKGLGWRKKLEANFTNARALEAYYGGQQRLASYQRRFEPGDLDDAEKEFRWLTSEMPEFVPGLMLLGSTLLEKRSEADAIRAFERARDLLAPAGTLPANADATVRKAWLQARLLTAVARLQMYGLKDNHEALRILEGLIHDIPNAGAAGVSPHDLYEYRKFHFSVLSQIAHTVGHDLTLLKPDNFVEALTEPAAAAPGAPLTVPESVRPPPPRAQLLRTHADAVAAAANAAQLEVAKTQLMTDFEEEITRIFEKQQALLSRATVILNGIDSQVAHSQTLKPDDVNRLDADAWKHVRQRFIGDLRNADGYAHFRYAQVHEPTDDSFREQCKIAISKLIEAQAARPNEYTIMQNLGMIYADPRYDSSGSEIETARAQFNRSLEIKRRDFYGYQELAKLSIRQAYKWGPEFLSLDAIKGAIAQVEKAREFRPGSSTNFVLLAQLYILKWDKVTAAEQQEAASLIEASLAAAQRIGPDPALLGAAQLQWQLSRLRASAGQPEFDKAKTKFLAAVHAKEIELKGNPQWGVRDLVARAERLRAKAENLAFEDRSTLRWLE